MASGTGPVPDELDGTAALARGELPPAFHQLRLWDVFFVRAPFFRVTTLRRSTAVANLPTYLHTRLHGRVLRLLSSSSTF